MTDQHDKALDGLLKDYPMPKPDSGFYDEALARAAVRGAQRQQRRWWLGGAGSAVAAGLAAWVVFGVLLTSPNPVENGIPEVVIALKDPETVRLLFASAEPLDGAMITVMLPDGVELEGFPGQREVSWETSLAAGKNVLPLKLIALKPAGGELYATLKHQSREKDFRVKLNIASKG